MGKRKRGHFQHRSNICNFHNLITNKVICQCVIRFAFYYVGQWTPLMINIQLVGYKNFDAFEQRCHVQQGKVMNCGGGGSCGTCIVEV